MQVEAQTDTELPDATHDEEISALPLPSFSNQVAGHKGISHEGGAILVPEPGKIAKPVGRGYFAGEDRFYRSLSSYPALAEFCPAYLGTRQFGGRDYVVLEDLTHEMQRPLVVDIKVGTCTVAPDAPWMKRITHLAKDRATTTRSLGLRVVGAQTSQHGRGTDWAPVRLGKTWGKALRAEDMSAALRTVFSADGRLCTAALTAFLPRLHQLARVRTPAHHQPLMSHAHAQHSARSVRAPWRPGAHTTRALHRRPPPRPRLPSLNPHTRPLTRRVCPQVLEMEPRWHLVSSSLLFVFQADGEPASPGGTRAPSDEPPSAGAGPALRVIDFAHAYPLLSMQDSGVRATTACMQSPHATPPQLCTCTRMLTARA